MADLLQAVTRVFQRGAYDDVHRLQFAAWRRVLGDSCRSRSAEGFTGTEMARLARARLELT